MRELKTTIQKEFGYAAHQQRFFYKNREVSTPHQLSSSSNHTLLPPSLPNVPSPPLLRCSTTRTCSACPSSPVRRAICASTRRPPPASPSRSPPRYDLSFARAPSPSLPSVRRHPFRIAPLPAPLVACRTRLVTAHALLGIFAVFAKSTALHFTSAPRTQELRSPKLVPAAYLAFCSCCVHCSKD